MATIPLNLVNKRGALLVNNGSMLFDCGLLSLVSGADYSCYSLSSVSADGCYCLPFKEKFIFMMNIIAIFKKRFSIYFIISLL